MSIVYKIKAIIYSLLPSLAQNSIKRYKQDKAEKALETETFEYDKERLYKYAFSYNRSLHQKLCHLRMLTHFIEKGLTMPRTRPCFGIMRLRQIASLVEEIGEEYSQEFEMIYISKVIDEYILFHKSIDITLPEENQIVISRIKKIVGDNKKLLHIKQRHYKKEDYFTTKDGFFSTLAHSRHSARNYISKEISEEIFIEIAKITATAPSACNRQSCKMHVITKKDLIEQVFSLGVGCNGFGHLAPAIIIVTSDIACRDNITERHQIGVDAGFFGMNLLYALHEKQIGACILNWDNIRATDIKLRKLVPSIKDEETVLFIISCGYTPDEFDIPLGLKIPIENVISFN